jgi:hypothetical protein
MLYNKILLHFVPETNFPRGSVHDDLPSDEKSYSSGQDFLWVLQQAWCKNQHKKRGPMTVNFTSLTPEIKCKNSGRTKISSSLNL